MTLALGYFAMAFFISGLGSEVSYGPFCFSFSWASPLLSVIGDLIRIFKISEIIFPLWSSSGLLIIVIPFLYLLSLQLVNNFSVRKFKWGFPYLAIVYHVVGIIISYPLRTRLEGDAVHEKYLFIFYYPVILILAIGYIYWDWKFAKKRMVLRIKNG